MQFSSLIRILYLRKYEIMFKVVLSGKLKSVSILFLILGIILIEFQQQSFSETDNLHREYSISTASESNTLSVFYPTFPLTPGINQCGEDSVCAEHSQDLKERQAQTILNRVFNNSVIQELMSISP
jgi:hypothetical protein